MAIMDFYTEIVIIAGMGVGVLGVLWKTCNDKIDKVESSASEEGYLITSHIWTTSIKDSVEEFFFFIQKNTAESESKDKFAELFGDKDKIDVLKERLDRLNQSHKSYLDFNNLYPRLIHEIEESRKWLIRTICLCFGFAVWAAVGFLIEAQGSSLASYTSLFWCFLILLVFLTTFSLSGFVRHSRKCGMTESVIRREKSKYGTVIKKAV